MNNRNRGMGFGGGGYSYGPLGKAEELEDVRVGIWSTKGFVARWTSPAPAPGRSSTSTSSPSAPTAWPAPITNRLPVPLKDTIVAFGKQVYYKVGTIAAGRHRPGRADAGPVVLAAPQGEAGLAELPAGESLREPDREHQPRRPAPRDDVPRQRRDRPGDRAEPDPPRPRPDRPARPGPADAGRADRPPRHPARPGQRPGRGEDRADHAPPRDPAAEARPRARRSDPHSR